MEILNKKAGELAAKDVFTYASVGFGIAGVAFALQGADYAPVFVLLAVVADFLDGKVARWTNKFNDFGLQLDSLADAVSFGAVPAVLGILLSNAMFDWTVIATAIFFCICIVTRLAWFNLQDPKMEKGVYYGLPSPLAAIGATFVPWYFAWDPAVTAASLLVFGFLAVSAFKTSKSSMKKMLGPLGIIFS
ncbi:MAG: CDP-alcohol phosphatidyltransferase family protein [Candidatus Micrarchaeia archaeon]|jgi:CDP-diacylglycerol--serine O-phosphatidyltransferase